MTPDLISNEERARLRSMPLDKLGLGQLADLVARDVDDERRERAGAMS